MPRRFPPLLLALSLLLESSSLGDLRMYDLRGNACWWSVMSGPCLGKRSEFHLLSKRGSGKGSQACKGSLREPSCDLVLRLRGGDLMIRRSARLAAARSEPRQSDGLAACAGLSQVAASLGEDSAQNQDRVAGSAGDDFVMAQSFTTPATSDDERYEGTTRASGANKGSFKEGVRDSVRVPRLFKAGNEEPARKGSWATEDLLPTTGSQQGEKKKEKKDRDGAVKDSSSFPRDGSQDPSAGLWNGDTMNLATENRHDGVDGHSGGAEEKDGRGATGSGNDNDAAMDYLDGNMERKQGKQDRQGGKGKKGVSEINKVLQDGNSENGSDEPEMDKDEDALWKQLREIDQEENKHKGAKFLLGRGDSNNIFSLGRGKGMNMKRRQARKPRDEIDSREEGDLGVGSKRKRNPKGKAKATGKALKPSRKNGDIDDSLSENYDPGPGASLGSDSSSAEMEDVDEHALGAMENESDMDRKYFADFLAFERARRYPDPSRIPRFVNGTRVPTELDDILAPDAGEPERFEKDMIFVVGGYTGPVVQEDHDEQRLVIPDVERFSPHEIRNGEARWRCAPEMQRARSAHAVCALGGKIYAMGGQAHDGGDISIGGMGPQGGEPLGGGKFDPGTASHAAHNKEPYHDLDSVESLGVFPHRSESWQWEPKLSCVRIGFGAGTLGNRIYVAGGFNGGRFVSSVESLGIGDKQWRKEPSLIADRQGHAVAVQEQRMYVLGGHDFDYILDSTEYLDIGADQWLPGPTLQRKRHFPAAAASKDTGRIYALGGWALKAVEVWDERQGKNVQTFGTDYETQRSVESLDPREGKWRKEPSMNRMRIYHTAVCSGASLFAMGGCDEDGVATDSVERLDLRMNGQWVEEAAMQINRTYAGSALISPDNMFW